jgi:hypothetical protein
VISTRGDAVIVAVSAAAADCTVTTSETCTVVDGASDTVIEAPLCSVVESMSGRRNGVVASLSSSSRAMGAVIAPDVAGPSGAGMPDGGVRRGPRDR